MYPGAQRGFQTSRLIPERVCTHSRRMVYPLTGACGPTAAAKHNISLWQTIYGVSVPPLLVSVLEHGAAPVPRPTQSAWRSAALGRHRENERRCLILYTRGERRDLL